MKNKKYILFDLDGTLTDPGEGITNSVRYALERYGIYGKTRSELECFIGPPLSDSFEKYFGMSHEQAMEAIEVYREYFRPRGMFENEVYEGIPELLENLCSAGKTAVLATSKPGVFADRILEHFDLMKYFTVTVGSELDGARIKKAEVIACALEKLGVTDTSECVMIGDRSHDIIGGKENSLDTVGVLYGYGSREELEEAGADIIAADVASLSAILL